MCARVAGLRSTEARVESEVPAASLNEVDRAIVEGGASYLRIALRDGGNVDFNAVTPPDSASLSTNTTKDGDASARHTPAGSEDVEGAQAPEGADDDGEVLRPDRRSMDDPALFGPLVFKRSHQQSVAANCTVPIRVAVMDRGVEPRRRAGLLRRHRGVVEFDGVTAGH